MLLNRVANNYFAPFALRMLRIFKDSGQGICKHRDCLFKRNTVFCLIPFGFLRVPLELKWHPAEMLPRYGWTIGNESTSCKGRLLSIPVDNNCHLSVYV